MKLFRNFEKVDHELALRLGPSNVEAWEGTFLAPDDVVNEDDVEISPPEVSLAVSATESFPSEVILGTQPPKAIVGTSPPEVIPPSNLAEVIVEMSQLVISPAPL
jgi:hypothetical protein